jgi:hypothetical protein
MNRRAFKLWTVNVLSFILFCLLSLTGLINWLVLPKGFEARGSFSASMRHFLVEVHQWAGLLFLVIIGLHILWHWTYIKSKLSTHRILK